MSKVFCLGLWKNGTKSMGKAFRLLGYRTHSRFWGVIKDIGDRTIQELHEPNYWKPVWNKIQTILDSYDAFADTPWQFVYEKLYQWYPDAKFILTLRRDAMAVANSEYWHNIRHGLKPSQIPDRQYFADRYEYHNKRIREYFKDKELLELIIEDNNWASLCEFLDKPIPDIVFPHLNKGSAELYDKYK